MAEIKSRGADKALHSFTTTDLEKATRIDGKFKGDRLTSCEIRSLGVPDYGRIHNFQVSVDVGRMKPGETPREAVMRADWKEVYVTMNTTSAAADTLGMRAGGLGGVTFIEEEKMNLYEVITVKYDKENPDNTDINAGYVVARNEEEAKIKAGAYQDIDPVDAEVTTIQARVVLSGIKTGKKSDGY